MENFVEESLNEFQRGQNIKKTLDVGGKPEKIEAWLKNYVFKKQIKLNPGLTIDIAGDFILEQSFYGDLRSLPDYIKFNKVSGDFIMEAAGLNDLTGFPEEVGGDFYIGHTKLVALENSPKKVGGDYIIASNEKKFAIREVETACEVNGNIIV